MKSFGSSEVLSAGSPAMCCDVCLPHPLCDATTNIFRHVAMRRRPRQVMIRTVSSSQCKGLQRTSEEERDVILANDVCYRMLGKEVVLPTASIVELCKQQSILNTKVILNLFQVSVWN